MIVSDSISDNSNNLYRPSIDNRMFKLFFIQLFNTILKLTVNDLRRCIILMVNVSYLCVVFPVDSAEEHD